MAPRVSVALALALALCGAGPAAGPVVRVQQCKARGDSVVLAITMDVAATPTAVWRVITDYEGMERFVPGVERSRKLSRTPAGQLVEQSGTMTSLPLKPRIAAVLEMRERAPSLLVFRGVSGTFPRLHGFWLARPLGTTHTRVSYRCTVGLDASRPTPPDALLGWVVRREITPRVRAIGREAERRAAGR